MHQRHVRSPANSTIKTNKAFKAIANTPVITDNAPNLISNPLIPITPIDIQNIDAPYCWIKKMPSDRMAKGQ